jgi:hypothetical protein
MRDAALVERPDAAQSAPPADAGGGDTGTLTSGFDPRAPIPPYVVRSWDLADGAARRGDAWRQYREGMAALGRSDLEGAERLLLQVLETDRSYEAAYGALAVVYMRAKSYPRCVEISRQCVNRVLDGDRLGACYYNLGTCLEHLGVDDLAFEAYRRSLESRANDVVEKRLGLAARRLGRARPDIARLDRDSVVKAASTSFLHGTCETGITTDDRPGVLSCGGIAAWGAVGTFSEPGVDEVLLAVADDRVPREKGGGYGVLMRKVSAEWQELARTSHLAPGQGGLDFEGTLRRPDGTDVVVVQVSDCWEGCCEGHIRAIGLARRGDSIGTTATDLLPVGSSREDPAAPSLRAFVTGARPIDEDRDGHSGLLLRYETRLGKNNPSVRYVRVDLVGGAPRVLGKTPPRPSLPRCGP